MDQINDMEQDDLLGGVVLWSRDQIDLFKVSGASNTTDFWAACPEEIVAKLPSIILEEIDGFLELYFDEMEQRGVASTQVKLAYSEMAGYVKVACIEKPFYFLATVTIYSDETIMNAF